MEASVAFHYNDSTADNPDNMSDCMKNSTFSKTLLLPYEPEGSQKAVDELNTVLVEIRKTSKCSIMEDNRKVIKKARGSNTCTLKRFISFYPSAVTEFLQLAVPLINTIVSLPVNQLRPNPISSSLLMSLRNLIHKQNLQENEVSLILSHSAIRRCHKNLLEKFSLAEYFWEVDFAEQIISGKKLNEQDSYSYDDYESCVQFEMNCVKKYAKNISIRKVAVIGSGPVPLTSVEVLKHLPQSGVVTNYDCSEEAVRLSKILIEMECKERLFVRQRSALSISAKDLDQVNLVYLAALVGTDKKEKENIIEHLYSVMSMGSILVARTSVGLNRLLYAELTVEEFGHFDDVQVFHPTDDALLTIICGRKCGKR
ncbi:Nicotianamine synthase 1 [Pseudolycoriella hygida]|uniref:Nicotianamine synthase 1 n=1 Tax=Pseudolycoriella hygida TaxID=35572 RepID=A0A9Q0RXY8_9DIPT|nr:Nicotianamine synthase 1 [Pseudolycoriella hygida]